MRRYDIVSGILLILQLRIINFALAAPVLVREKRHACVDVVHIPKDVITVLGKRGDDEIEKLAEEYFKKWGKPVESSDAHASSSSAPPGPDHGPTNVVQSPTPNLNPAPSTANPDPLIEPSGPSPATASLQGSWEDHFNFNAVWDDVSSNKGDDEFLWPVYPGTPSWSPTSAEYGSDHQLNQLTEAHAPQSNPNKRPWTDPDHELTWPNALQPNPMKRPLTDPDPDFDWNYWMAYVNRPGQGPALPKEFGQANKYQAEHVQQPNPVPSTASDSDRIHSPAPVPVVHPASTSAGLPTEPEHGSKKEPEYDVFHGPRPTPELTDPEFHLDHQPLSTDNLLAAIYAAKGKGKESRRISGTTGDVGNVAQRELQPEERSLDLGE